MLSYIETHKNIKTIIIGKRWTKDKERIQMSFNLVKFLIKNGLKVIIVGPVPYPGRDVEVWWASEQIKLQHSIEEITFKRTSKNINRDILDNLRQEFDIELKQNKIVIIDPVSKLCENDKCYAVRNDKAYFRDTNHLTEVSSLLMLPDFVSALRQLNE